MAPTVQLSWDSTSFQLCLEPIPSAPTVIVVGGGVAGLAAAHTLKSHNFKKRLDVLRRVWTPFQQGGPVIQRSNAEYQRGPLNGGMTGAISLLSWLTLLDNSYNEIVIVLESRNRIGGRVFTDDTFGFPVDMGASWLHGVCKTNPLAQLVGRLGLAMYRTCDDNSVLYDHDLKSYALYDIEGRKVPQQLVKEVGYAFEAVLEETKKVRDESGTDMSITQAFSLVMDRRPELRQDGLRHKVLQWYLCRMEGWFATDTDNISVQGWDEEELIQGGHGLMINGYQPVVTHLAEGLDIRLEQKVKRVIRGIQSVRVVTEDGTVFNADAAVITVPLGVLKAGAIRFEPRLPNWKEGAIADLGFGNENKIALFFEKATWPNVEFIGVVASTSYGCSYFLNLHKATGHPVLVYMPAGRLANDIEKLSDEAAASFAVTQLKKILPSASEPFRYLVTRWGTDPSSFGCYSYDAVGKPHDLYERLRSRVDNLFWAGEATSQKYPGTVHGAFATGLLAAEECYKRFSELYRDLELFQVPVLSADSEHDTLKISRL